MLWHIPALFERSFSPSTLRGTPWPLTPGTTHHANTDPPAIAPAPTPPGFRARAFAAASFHCATPSYLLRALLSAPSPAAPTPQTLALLFLQHCASSCHP